MDEKKQIEELANDIHCATHTATALHCDKYKSCYDCEYRTYRNRCHDIVSAKFLVTAGYRKQSVGEWKDNHCTNCGMMPLGEEMWTRLDLTPPKFEWFMNYCPICGARMKGGEQE